jgi:hypothetical protein
MATTSFYRTPILPSIPSKKEELDHELTEEISYSSKLSNVESQRIMAVLQELQRKVQLIGFLPENNDKKLSTALNGDGLQLVKDMTALELKYKMLLDTKQADVNIVHCFNN